MRVGDLVEITRPRIGVPKNTVGLIMDRVGSRRTGLEDLKYFLVQFIGEPGQRQPGLQRRFLPQDLKVIS